MTKPNGAGNGHAASSETKPKRKRGRPSRYSDKLAVEICRRISLGELLKNICNDEHLPAYSTVMHWLWSDEYEHFARFRHLYAQARAAQADAFLEEAMNAARTANDKDSAAAARVLADTIKWAAARLNPQKYGDVLRHAGHDGGPIKHSVGLEKAITAQQAAERQRARLEGPKDDAIDIEAEEIEVSEPAQPISRQDDNTS